MHKQPIFKHRKCCAALVFPAYGYHKTDFGGVCGFVSGKKLKLLGKICHIYLRKYRMGMAQSKHKKNDKL